MGTPHPNPTTNAVTVPLTLSEATEVYVAVYDVLGRLVATLADGHRVSGTHALSLDTATLAPGLYVVRVTGLLSAATQTFTVVR